MVQASYDRVLLLGGLFTSLAGLGAALVLELFNYLPGMGPILIGTALAFTLWYGLCVFAIPRTLAVTFFRAANPIVAILLPILFSAAFIRALGPQSGLGAWITPLLYALILAMSALHMQPLVPIVLGVLGGASYGLFFELWVRPQLVGATDLYLTHAGPGPRIIGILLVGFASAGIAVALRRTVAQAVDDDRKRSLLGKYVLGPQIASGGMGIVSRATYCPEGGFVREVAIKQLHPHLAGDPQFVDGFRQEAELSARLVHPNIVGVLDFGRAQDTYFLAMEYVDGWSLRHLLDEMRKRDRRLPESLVGLIGTELLSGLDHAHNRARGDDGCVLHVVHRDLSPANILVSRAGVVKLTDFGIARALKDATEHQTCRVVGKLSYLAPEVAAGKPFDTRADLYAVGLILYELLTLSSPHRRASETSTWRAVLRGGSPGVRQHRSDVSDGWGAFFARALARDPAARFSDASEMKSALLRVVPPSAFPLVHEVGPLLERMMDGKSLPGPERLLTLTHTAQPSIHSELTARLDDQTRDVTYEAA